MLVWVDVRMVLAGVWCCWATRSHNWAIPSRRCWFSARILVNISFMCCMRDENWVVISSRATCWMASRASGSRDPWLGFVDGKVEGDVSRDAWLTWCCVWFCWATMSHNCAIPSFIWWFSALISLNMLVISCVRDVNWVVISSRVFCLRVSMAFNSRDP